MAHLSVYLLAQDVRPAVISGACDLIDEEVRRASGISGLAIRSAYRVVSGVRPGMVASAVDGLLAPFADQLDPFYQEHLHTGEPLAEVLTTHRSSLADALLSITDDRAERTSNRAVRRAYQRVRGAARQHVEAAAPGIGELLATHTPPHPALDC